ncbi:hypothetical protein MGYG_06482 [Nannizzia gypsea CBS 118893]|uniref:Uncharacterized protein n=1 Tax=Arthroderma gypseum (strain ATCC MYA-4604 / CBS 118893) TaxID=535722 RepID=E4UZF4_ARTGP|nr:hypothetical protein MGYG_06482 [Nannizzia gypsea CBS 118893]EFR03484.1 hypothetical protein MGYG_06482 [Nannizzia gypsea CBS 118893]
MAPLASGLFSRASFDSSITFGEFRDQWITPGDVFSILLILGSDVVHCALAQLAGSGVAPVSFSFGWVAYSIAALSSAVGENKLMPPDPDCKCKVINGRGGYVRDNSSWILGRIVRDFGHWKDNEIQKKLDSVLDQKFEKMRMRDKDAERPPMAGLIVSIYEPSTSIPTGTVKRDMVYWMGLAVLVLQLAIASVACGVYGEWGTLFVTVVGIVLSLATGLLPQWKKEKWACRRKAKDSYILTRGNGSQHAIVVRGNRRGFNLEDLASGQDNVMVATNLLTSIALLVLAVLWILLLITAAGIKHNTWFLLAVGSIGILQNIYVAGAPRRPENFGIPLDFVEVIGQPSTMETLLEVEEKYEKVGRSMLEEFFPGSLTGSEQERWDEIARNHGAAKKDAQ